jgi:hypothetical protein
MKSRQAVCGIADFNPACLPGKLQRNPQRFDQRQKWVSANWSDRLSHHAFCNVDFAGRCKMHEFSNGMKFI